ncbi:MAG: hypothetical protein ACRC6U_09170 [Fusobacteriaceae bacterium]
MLGKKLIEIYGNRNIQTLMSFMESGEGYLYDGSKSIFLDMQKVESVKDRNRRNKLQTQIKINMKLFLKDVFDNIVPSPNLIAFYTGIELDIIISKFIGIEAAFAREAVKESGLLKDYGTLTSQLREQVTITLPEEPIFSLQVKESWIKSLVYLGKMLVRTYKYNEFMYNHNTLVEELDKNNEIYALKYDLEWENLDFIGEKDICKQIYYRIYMILEFFISSKDKMKELDPENYELDIRYIKTTITKLKNSLEITKKEVENKKVKKVSSYQKYSGINLKNWKSIR